MKAQVELVRQDIKQHLASLFHAAQDELVIASPYVSIQGAQSLRQSVRERFRRSGRLHFLTDLSPHNVCQGATEPRALKMLTEDVSQHRVSHLPRLHAKVYVADRAMAVIASANLTAGGLARNYEYGVKLSDSAAVEWIRDDILAYSALGAEIDSQRLADYCAAADEVRGLYSKTRKDKSDHAVRLFESKAREMEDDLIRCKLGSGAVHTVFQETILYLLRKHGPLKTEALHPLIAEIHPELCDEAVDRIIDGRTFGKKWKHAARTAQQMLKKRGRATFTAGQWEAC